jgi:HPt (histidine-containing phosphotransfer) domain-containing protein
VHERQTASPEVFDERHALSATGDDPELLREIVTLFLEDCPRMVAALERAPDAAALCRAAHTLKGSVAVLGAQALAAAAREVEELARAGDPAVAAAIARVREEARRVRPVLERLLAG